MSPKTLLFVSVITTAGLVAPSVLAAPGDNVRQGRAPVGPQVMFNMLDANGDGALDAAELGELTQAVIAAVDTDDDGVLSPAEVRPLMRGLGGQRFQRRGDRDNVREHRRQRPDAAFQRDRGGPFSEERRARIAERFGIDGDGLTQDEFLQRQVERFEALDVIVHSPDPGLDTIGEVVRELAAEVAHPDLDSGHSRLARLLARAVPGFEHADRGRSLDQKA